MASARRKEIPIDDLIDIGVFTGAGKAEKTIFLEKRRVTSPTMEFEVVVPAMPARAGIDPYNKLFDRAPDDNTVAATEQKR